MFDPNLDKPEYADPLKRGKNSPKIILTFRQILTPYIFYIYLNIR